MKDGQQAYAQSSPSLQNKVLKIRNNSDPLPYSPMHTECGWQSERVKSDNGRSNSMMADSHRRKHRYGILRQEESSRRSEGNISRWHTLIVANVMKGSTTNRPPERPSRLDATVPLLPSPLT
eukprot:13607671-Heterocapsa_arctica.AAC.1